MSAAHEIGTSAKRLARMMLARGPVYTRARARALSDGAVTVLMYHTVGHDDEAFDAWTVVRRADFLRQMDWLRRHYDVVALDDALVPTTMLARPRAVVTFDDGEAGLHEHLLPIVEREAIPVVVYVATGQIASGQPYWFDRVMNSAQVARPTVVDVPGLPRLTLGAACGEREWQAVSALLSALKQIEPEARERAADAVDAALALSQRGLTRRLAPMSLAQLRDLAGSRWVTIGAHTHCHSLLNQMPLDAALETIERSRVLLREWTGQEVRHFAYPNGNYSGALVAAVERMGFRSAMATVKGLWHPEAGRFDIRRVPVGRWDDLDRFRLNLLGGARSLLGGHVAPVRSPGQVAPPA
jgi:peptidoglycan/xylan/chitin deacetylase (PgdA/CDA1 family)